MGDNRKDRWLPLWRLAQLAGLIASILLISSQWHPAMGAEQNRSVIFVIDSSENMAPYLFNVKALIFTFADQAKRGDNLGIISVSDIPNRIALKKISSKRDRQSVEFWLNAIEAGGKQADVIMGVSRALQDIEQLHRKGDRNLKGIVVISSSQSPEKSPASEILEKAVSELSEQVSGKEWYIQYCYLNGTSDPRVEAFASRNQGFSYNIDELQLEHGTETIEELYKIISSPEEVCPVNILDLKGTLQGKTSTDGEWIPFQVGTHIPEKTELRVASDSRAVIELKGIGRIGLDSETELSLLSARKELITKRGLFGMALNRGSLWMASGKKKKNSLILRTAGTLARLSGTAGVAKYHPEMDRLSVSSFSAPFSVKVGGEPDKQLNMGTDQMILLEAGKMLGEIEPAEVGTMEQWKFWRQAFYKNTPLAALDFTVPEVTFSEEAITIGPIKSGEIQNRRVPIRVSGVDDASKVKMDVDISLALPEGLALSTGIIEGEEPNTKILNLRVDGSGKFRSERSDTYPGILSIVPKENSRVMFERISVPITIETKGPIVPRPVLFICAGIVLVGAIALGTMFSLRSKASVRPRPHGVIGRMITINDPTGGRVGTINLEELGTKSSRLSLMVGRDRTADVRLKHASVSREHCTLEAYLIGGRLETFIEPIGSVKAEVDGEIIRSGTRLTDGAKIKVGDFVYQFEDSQLYKKVEVMRRNGRRISGILDAAGMDAKGFRLSPMDAVSPSERARVKFSDIRYAIFYRRATNVLSGTPRPMIKTDSMKKIELMFRKGDTISGYVRREYEESRRRFVELIPLDPDSAIDYTVVDCSFAVEKKTL
jgi:hypothetical protein